VVIFLAPRAALEKPVLRERESNKVKEVGWGRDRESDWWMVKYSEE
jgi:hypothetical protein